MGEEADDMGIRPHGSFTHNIAQFTPVGYPLEWLEAPP